jgi:hypothetical protein
MQQLCALCALGARSVLKPLLITNHCPGSLILESLILESSNPRIVAPRDSYLVARRLDERCPGNSAERVVVFERAFEGAAGQTGVLAGEGFGACAFALFD